MPSEPYSVDAVPGPRGLGVPELLPPGLHDGVHAGVGVVHEHIELTPLFGLDPIEEGFDLLVIRVVHLDGDRLAAAGLE